MNLKGTPAKRSEAQKLARKGFSAVEIARKLGVSRATIFNWKKTPEGVAQKLGVDPEIVAGWRAGGDVQGAPDTTAMLRAEIQRLRSYGDTMAQNGALAGAAKISRDITVLLSLEREWNPPPPRVETPEERAARMLPDAKKVVEKVRKGAERYLDICRQEGHCPVCSQPWGKQQ